jgi:regulator of protease activity HflC (stomatin/prohibitin superfamily)
MSKTLNLICVIAIAFIVGAWTISNVLMKRVDLGQVGVRTQNYPFFGAKGVKDVDYGPGWHRDLGPIDSWEVFDATVQTLEFTRTLNRGDRAGRDDVSIISADGNPVSVDVTVKYRIKDGKAHLLYQKIGAGDAYKAFVRNESLDTFRIVYGELRTEDFYNPEKRAERTKAATQLLSKKLEQAFIQVDDILVRDVLFEEGYEQKIRQKKLADQDVELNKSRAIEEEMKGNTRTILAETEALVKVISSEKDAALVKMKADTDKKIATIKADADKYVTEMKADADLFLAEQTAKGTLLEKQSEAKGEQLKAQALQGTGGANFVALETARNVNLGDITVSTVDTPFLDVDWMTKKFGARDK